MAREHCCRDQTSDLMWGRILLFEPNPKLDDNLYLYTKILLTYATYMLLNIENHKKVNNYRMMIFLFRCDSDRSFRKTIFELES